MKFATTLPVVQAPAFSKPQSCAHCVGAAWPDKGFMPAPAGTGTNGVLLVGEALGEQEALAGKPFQGKAGLALHQMMQRVGLKRDDFLVDNVLRCRPPANKLNNTPYEAEVIRQCRPYLDGSLNDPRVRVVVPMGEIAFQRVVGLQKSWKITPNRGYVWRGENGKWVLPTFHPAYIMRGQHKLRGVFLNDLLRAKRIAEEGFTPHRLNALLDPDPLQAEGWIIEYERALRADVNLHLAYDIETPMKAEGLDEGELEVDDPSYIILRVGYSYGEGNALSMPFTTSYLHLHRRLLASPGPKVVWNGAYDRPRLEANGVPIEGVEWDMMWGWHVLNSDLPKGLGFVAPFYCHDQQAWKHLNDVQPAFYNATDVEVEWRIAAGILRDLERHNLRGVFDRHVVKLQVPLNHMSRTGLLIDMEVRREVSLDLQHQLGQIDQEIAAVVPREARQFFRYKKLATQARPVGATDKVEAEVTWMACPGCGAEDPPKPHFKLYKKPTEKKPQNPCGGLQAEQRSGRREVWARILPWVPSVKQLSLYARLKRHKAKTILDKEAKAQGLTRYKETFDDDALKELIGKYPQDRLYPLVRQRREVEKELTTYVGVFTPSEQDPLVGSWAKGLPVGADGRVHTTFTNNPSTLRLSSQAPNLQNIKRDAPEGKRSIKEMFVAGPGQVLVELDYSAIEAVLVGYEAGSETYIRLAKLGVHDFLNSHILHRAGKIPAPAEAGWEDGRLRAFLQDLKARFKTEREVAKRIVHGGNYGMTPFRMVEVYPEYFPAGWQEAASLQALYYEVCPDVKTWQLQTVKKAEEEGFLRNPFGYLHRFWRVLEWEKDREGNWVSKWGEDAKRALAFGPQSTASGIIKEAILKVWESPWGRYLRLQVHDSLLLEFPNELALEGAHAVMRLMAEPVPQLKLPWEEEAWLSVGVEGKWGPRWAGMKGLPPLPPPEQELAA